MWLLQRLTFAKKVWNNFPTRTIDESVRTIRTLIYRNQLKWLIFFLEKNHKKDWYLCKYYRERNWRRRIVKIICAFCNITSAIMSGNIKIVEDKLRYTFNNNVIFDGYFDYCETFKLEFDNNFNLINIKNIRKKI